MFFSIGMYVVVYGLRNVGLTEVLAILIEATADHGLFAATIGMGFNCSHSFIDYEQHANRYD